MLRFDFEWLRRAMLRVLALLILFGPLLAIYRDLRCGYPAADGCSVFKDISEFQTLIAAVIALLAALYAVKPVKEQLRVMALQSAVQCREVLMDRMKQLEGERASVQALISKVEEGMLIRWKEIEFEPDDVPVDTNWAFFMNQLASEAASDLVAWNRVKYDFEQIEVSRFRLCTALNEMSSCFDSIHRPASMDMDGEEFFSTESQAQILDEATVQEKRVPDVSRAVTQTAEALDAEFEKSIIAVGKKVRRIDNTILASDVI